VFVDKLVSMKIDLTIEFNFIIFLYVYFCLKIYLYRLEIELYKFLSRFI